MALRSTFGSVWPRILLLAAMTALAACAAPGPAADKSARSGAAGAENTARIDPTALDPDAAIRPNPPAAGELIGMVAEQVAGRIGRPDHVWREPPAAVWQYSERGCVLHVFLYPEAGDMRVRHVELRGGAAAAGSGDCYRGLVEATKPAARG